jgi:cytoskeletal protein CcmA (bactofilin family)
MKKKGLWLGVLLLLLLLPASAAFADGPRIAADGGRIFVDEDLSLEPGEVFDGDVGIFNGDLDVPKDSVIKGDVFVTNGDVEVGGRIDGSLAVVSGDLTLEQGAVVEGDLFVMTGDHEVAGRVSGDLSLMFGDGNLRDTAVVEGDLMVLSGNLQRAAGARVGGEEMSDLRLPELPFMRERINPPAVPELPEMPEMPALPEVPALPRIRTQTPAQEFGRLVGRVVTAGFFSLVFIALGVLIVFIWRRPTRRVSECIAAMPVQSFALGLLTFLIAAVLEAFAAVLLILIILVAAALIGTVILIPVGLLLILLSVLVLVPVPLGLVAAMVLGWVGLAELIGRKVLKALKATDVKPLGAMLVGLLITVGVAAVLWILQPACCAWPFVILLTSVGLGAVVHTRFGRQSCRPPQPAAEADVLPPEAMDEEAGQADGPADETP